MTSKTHISGQKPRERQLNAKVCGSLLCSTTITNLKDWFEYSSDGKYTKPHPKIMLGWMRLCIFTSTFILPCLCTFWDAIPTVLMIFLSCFNLF